MAVTRSIVALLARLSPALSALAIGACGGDGKSTGDVAPADTSVSDSAVGDSAVGDSSADADAAPVTPAWQVVGAITTQAMPATPTPLFADRKSGLPAGVTLPEGRGAIVDFDNDGWDDIVAVATASTAPAKNTPVFLRNNHDWTFSDWTSESGMGASEMVLLVFGDIDNDGDQDAFVGTSFRSPSGEAGVWLNDGAGHFSYLGHEGLAPAKISGTVYKEMSSATLADFDRDGVLDLYLGTWNSGAANGDLYYPAGNELYKGDGTGNWAGFDLPEQSNPLTGQVDAAATGKKRAAYGVCPADFDDDGDIDVFVNNYGAGRPALGEQPHYWEWNFLWRNDGQMTFVDVGVPAQVAASMRGIGGVENEKPLDYEDKDWPSPIGGNGFSCDWGDFDNDGDLDLAVGQIAHPDYVQSDRLMLHVNPGGAPGSERIFGEESFARGLLYNEDELFPVWVDLDQDGRLDLAVSRLRRPSDADGGPRDPWDGKWLFYHQTAEQKFAAQAIADVGVDVDRPGPALLIDADHDGDLDVFFPKAAGKLFENVSATGHALTIRLVGALGKSPRDATGARVMLETSVGKQVRELHSGNGHYNNQNTRELHFGLGGDSGAHAVTIRWPDGEVQVLGDVKADLRLEVVQGGDVTILE
ncbi:MAG: CRTAC1 family protein [Myxococcota bacterium]